MIITKNHISYTYRWPTAAKALRSSGQGRLKLLSESPFKYKSPVSSQGIHLLEIDPVGVREDDIISLRLADFSLSCAPQYYTLLYTKDDTHDTINILCLGNTPTSTVLMLIPCCSSCSTTPCLQ